MDGFLTAPFDHACLGNCCCGPKYPMTVCLSYSLRVVAHFKKQINSKKQKHEKSTPLSMATILNSHRML